MKRKHLALAIAALLAAGGLWLSRSAGRSNHSPSQTPDTGVAAALQKSSAGFASNTSSEQPKPGQMPNPPARLAPPVPNRRFTDFTPEERVEFARRGHGPGG